MTVEIVNRRAVPAAPESRVTGPTTITRLPATVNLVLYQGDDFALTITVRDSETGQPFDLAGAEARAQIRVSPQTATVAGEFVTSIDGNLIILHLAGATSAGLPQRTVWDCDLLQGGRTTTLMAGTIAITPEVTR